jgi:threonine aldolase
VSLDFSKGLGAPMGAMILGNNDFVTKARRIRKGIGGGMRQAGVLSAAARAAVDETFGPGGWGKEKGGRLREVHRKAQRVAEMWTRKGGKLRRRVETNIVYVDLDETDVSEGSFRDIGRDFDIQLDGSRIVLHYQISEESLRRIEMAFAQVFSRT